MVMRLQYDAGGKGARLLLLLHGLGATRQVWGPLISCNRWNGRWIAPDLRGHGASAHASSYALGLHAADLAKLVSNTGSWDEIVILGHSMGGAIALALASNWFGIRPKCVFGLGIKVAWRDNELTALQQTAATPARHFATQDEAIARYLKISGLFGQIAPDSSVAASGVTRDGEGWRLASDAKCASIGAPPMSALMAASTVPVYLARGESDVLVSANELVAFDPQPCQMAGGHNAMVENPSGVWAWLDEKLA